MLKFFCKRKGFALQLDATQYLIIFVLLVGLGTFGWQNVQDYGRRDTAQADCTRIASAVSQYHFNAEGIAWYAVPDPDPAELPEKPKNKGSFKGYYVGKDGDAQPITGRSGKNGETS